MSAPVSSQAQGHAALPSAGRVLVVRLSAMGDVIHALPAITALRAACPNLKIGWLIERRWSELLCARGSDFLAPRSQRKPLVDWLHASNFAAWRGALLSGETWREMACVRREVRAVSYDLALDLQGAVRSAIAARASGARVLVGASQPREAPATMFYTRQVATEARHVVEQALAFASAIAAQPLQYAEPVFPVDPAAEARAEQICIRFDGKPFVLMSPGAGWGAKCWPAESFGEVACALAGRGFAVAVNHGPGEEALAHAVREFSRQAALPAQSSVGELIALTRRTRLFIGGDTGPLHLAAAMRVPVVALFGPTRAQRNGPYGTKSIVLRSPRSVYNTTHTDHPDQGLRSIPPQAVIEAADQLLGGGGD